MLERFHSIRDSMADGQRGPLLHFAQILALQQQGLSHLVATVENDTRVMDVILKGLSGVKLTGLRVPHHAYDDDDDDDER